MAIKSKAQIQAESNSTYIDNSVGSITPNSVRSLNTDWIDSIIFAEATASLTVFGATSASFANSATSASNALTASFLLGSVASASFAQFAVSSSQSTSASFATTASFISGNVASASFATSASRAISAATATSASFASTSTSASFATSASRAISSLSASYAFTASSATNSANAISASFATTASRAISSATATSASFASTSTSASFAQTASFALNVPATSSFAISASFAQSASLATRNILTASAAANILTFTKGDGTTFNVSIAQSGSIASASFADTANQANSASLAANSLLLQGTGSNGFVTTGSFNTASGSLSTRVTDNTSNIQTLTSATASYAVLANNQTFTGKNTFNNDVTASNVRITGTASIAFLDVTFQSSSVIYSSGSNQFGDASNDTQTLFGTVNVATGPLVVTGSANFKETITGSISGNAATATSSTSASYAFTASSAISASFASVAASVLGTITSASYAYTASSAENANTATSASNSTLLSGMPSSSFATTGSNLFKGNQTITGSNFLQQGGVFSIYNNDGTVAFALSTVGNQAQIQVPFTASSGISGNFQGDLTGTASFATNAATASVLLGTVASASYALTSSGVQGINASLVNSTYYLGFVPNADVNAISIDTDLRYNPNTGILSTNQVNASLNGNATTATNAATASLATSASYALSASQANNATSASFATTAATASFLLGTVASSSYAFTASSAEKAFEAVSASYALTASFATTAGTANSATTSTSASYALSASFAEKSVNTIVVTNNGASNYIIDGVARPVLTFVPGETYKFDTSGVVGSHPFRFSLTENGPTTYDVGVTIGTNYTEIEVDYATSSSLFYYCTNHSGMGNQANTLRSEDLIKASQTGSMSVLSSSFATNALTASFLIGGASSAITIADEGASQGTATFLNFTGAGVTATVSSNTASINIAGGAGSAFPFTGSAQITGSLGVTGSTSIIGSLSSTDKYLLGGDLSLIPVVSSQAVVTSFWGMQLVGNKQSSVDYSPSAIGANDDFSVIVPTQQATKIGLIVKGQTNQTGNLLELRDVNNVGWSAFSKSGSLSLGKTTATATLDILGNAIVTGSLNVNGGITGSLFGTATSASFATNAATASFFAGSVTSASFAQTSVTASFATNFVNSGSYVITGSHRGNVVSQSIASSTASFDFSTGNFFTLNLTGSTLTHISASNIQAGQTVNVRISQGATTGSVSFSSAFDQVSGSGYVPTQVANAVDILTFITFDNSLIYVSNIKNLV